MRTLTAILAGLVLVAGCSSSTDPKTQPPDQAEMLRRADILRAHFELTGTSDPADLAKMKCTLAMSDDDLTALDAVDGDPSPERVIAVALTACPQSEWPKAAGLASRLTSSDILETTTLLAGAVSALNAG